MPDLNFPGIDPRQCGCPEPVTIRTVWIYEGVKNGFGIGVTVLYPMTVFEPAPRLLVLGIDEQLLQLWR
jgi:hypothetical protein